mgnify:CR=1 FL=1
MNKKVKLISSYILLFIESIIFCLLILCIIFNRTFLNKDYVLKTVESANSYKTLFDSIKTEMSYYTEQSGFEDDILDGTFTLEEVTIEFNKFVNSVYDNTDIKIDSSVFKERLNDKIDKYIEKNNFEIINEEEINKFVDKLAEIYENKIKINGVPNYIKNTIQKINIKINKAIIILSISLVLLVLINMFIFKRKDLAIIFYFTSFFLIIMNIYIKNVIDLKNLFIYNQVITDPVNLIIDDVLLLFLLMSLVSFLIGIILSIIQKDKIVKNRINTK